MFRKPSPSDLRRSAEALGIELTDQRVGEIHQLLSHLSEGFDLVEQLPDDLPPVKYPRTPGYRPGPEENPLGAWYMKTDIKGAARGPLKGKRVAVKDNVCLAGVPMMNGASVLEGYVPEIDASIVTRLLDKGAHIVGKAVCEYFSQAGSSATSATGPVQNPRNPGYTPGGSSTGNAALVSAGEVDMAMGTDQAGSIRIPCSYSGIVGVKPTWGLIPYTGIMSIEYSIDHTGPMTKTVADNALFVDALAGPDEYDARQVGSKPRRILPQLDKGAKGLRVAVVREGFGQPESEPDVDAVVRQAAKRFESLGATVTEVSIPWHLYGAPIWGAVSAGAALNTFIVGNGFGGGTDGVYLPSLIRAVSAWPERANDLAPTVATTMILAQYLHSEFKGVHYAKAQNLRRPLRAAYNAALAEADVLVMPTTILKTTKIPPADAPFEDIMMRSWEMIGNTSPFDLTGHPALNVPCGLSDDRPVGMQLIARHWDEPTLYRAAHAFEQSADWQTLGVSGR